MPGGSADRSPGKECPPCDFAGATGERIKLIRLGFIWYSPHRHKLHEAAYNRHTIWMATELSHGLLIILDVCGSGSSFLRVVPGVIVSMC